MGGHAAVVRWFEPDQSIGSEVEQATEFRRAQDGLKSMDAGEEKPGNPRLGGMTRYSEREDKRRPLTGRPHDQPRLVAASDTGHFQAPDQPLVRSRAE